jgi:hypothetical protein
VQLEADGGGNAAPIIARLAMELHNVAARPSTSCCGAMRAATLLLGGLLAHAAQPPDRGRGGPAGIWVQHGSTLDLLEQTFVKGGDVTIAWKDVEVAKDVWNWTAMDEQFAAQAAAGFFIETSLQAGPLAPTWLYDDEAKGGAGLTPTLVVMSNHTGIRGQCLLMLLLLRCCSCCCCI